MNISKFLLIDTFLAISAIPLIFFIKAGNIKSSNLRRSNKENILGKTSIKLPEKAKLLELEKLARVKGSGIEFDSLVGNWKFISVWKKDTDDDNSIFSSLLRLFSANLELKKNISIEDQLVFFITVSIQFGIISIEFSGNAHLDGERPFLPFLFNRIELKSGTNTLLRKSLQVPAGMEKLFFELISIGENNHWLSARGQGGSLILWLKD